jgi:glycosyltransferase involved in cell wall biosynthesis
MNVLFLPRNVATQVQTSIISLRRLGVNARGLVDSVSPLDSNEGLESFQDSKKRSLFSPARYSRLSRMTYRFIEAVRWADIVHYHYGGTSFLPFGLDILIASTLRKPRVITFHGSDIRVPHIEKDGNPFYAKSINKYRRWSAGNLKLSRDTQAYYSQKGFHCVIVSESMIPHIQKDLFPEVKLIRMGIDTQSIVPKYPSPKKKHIKVLHSPSSPVIKGTEFVNSAMKHLQDLGGHIEFQTIQRLPRKEGLKILESSDVYLDQFVLGWYGMAAVEAMAFGKVVICYISPKAARLYSESLPIVNANPNDLSDTILEIACDGNRRKELGVMGREYVLRYHDALTNAKELIMFYKKILANKSIG